MLAETLEALMVLGQLALGKVPTAWSGRPLLVTVRAVAVQAQATVLVAFTEALALKALEV
jgi:hypothetical protein